MKQVKGIYPLKYCPFEIKQIEDFYYFNLKKDNDLKYWGCFARYNKERNYINTLYGVKKNINSLEEAKDYVKKYYSEETFK